MTTSPRRILLRDLHGTKSLVTRESAIEIARLIHEGPESQIDLDFGGIESTTRSFMDQLNHEIHRVPGKEVRIVNMTTDIAAMYDRVRRRRPKPQVDPSVQNAPVIRL
ncbi:MAG: hypothetical protein HY423_02235 [Candidatus Lambdaproteobacteria bacterium]|nr:hypothetical protein [Candidatus Lambdaproteobacteria bacterium]